MRAKGNQPIRVQSLTDSVASWFPRWKAEHCARTLRPDFPEDPDVAQAFFNGWREYFVLHGFTYEVATEASIQVAAENAFPNQHLQLMARFAKAIRKRMDQKHEESFFLRYEDAKEATYPWCECGRSGIVTRFRHASVRDGRGTDAAGTEYLCHCVCPLGQWMRQQLDDKDRRCFANLAVFPALQLGPVPWSRDPDNQFRYHPDDWDAIHGEPIAVDSNWREMVALLNEKGREALHQHLKHEVPRPYVSRRKPIEPATYTEPTPEDREKAERWRQSHLPTVAAGAEAAESDAAPF